MSGVDYYVWENLLLEIARTQSRLLSFSLDWNSRRLKEPPSLRRKGLFSRKVYASPEWSEREYLLQRLSQLQQSARERFGNQEGFYWWDIPWEQLEPYFLHDLGETEQDGDWRFEHHWEKETTGNIHELKFHEEGHCSSFHGQSSWQLYDTSRYSDSERREMAEKYSRELDHKEWQARLEYSDCGVESMWGQKYDSVDDYLSSSEHYLRRNSMQSNFEDSLVTHHENNTLRVSSGSIHYYSIYHTAKYAVTDDGWLAAWELGPYEVEKVRGKLPQEIVERRQAKDATVASAAFLADQQDIQRIPASLFGSALVGPLEEFENAVRHAEILTCLAEKIVFGV